MPLTARAARWCAGHPHGTLAAWLVFLSVAALGGAGTGLRLAPGLPGSATAVVATDPAKLLVLGAPVVVALLWLVLGSALVTLAAALFLGAVLATALGLVTALSSVLPTSHLACDVVVLLGVVVSADHVLFSVRRHQEAVADGRDIPDTAQVVAATAGRTALVSGIAIAVSMTGLWLVGDALLAPVAFGAIVVVAVSTSAALTLLPALLALLPVPAPRRIRRWWPGRVPALRVHRDTPRLAARLAAPVVGLLALLGLLHFLLRSAGVHDLPGAPPYLSGDAVLTLVLMLVLTVLVLLIAFRPILVALASVALGVLSVLVALGLLAMQVAHIPEWAPMVLLVVLSGPSTDIHVYLLHRFRSEALTGMSARHAMTGGVRRSASAIGGAVAVAFGACIAFGLAGTGEFRAFGWSTAAALLVDAVLVRTLVLPVLISLGGQLSWWRRITPRAHSRSGRGRPRPGSGGAARNH
ncbi:MMPL family transporter [Amycolatopsis magusensis]|uniref:MMPL family transporter n=1 Tax=Amycolatopsis magusensis TaxID=882444 RepID=UPI0037A12E19